MQTIHEWLNKTFIDLHLRGCAVGLAYKAFMAGRASALNDERTVEKGLTFEQWMEQPWVNSK